MSRSRSPTREVILACIGRYPGIHLRGIERELGLSSALVHYHVKSLETSGEVVAAAVGGYLRFYPADLGEGRGEISDEDREVLAALREEIPLHVILLLLDGGPTPQSDLVEELGLAKSTVSYHIDRLVARRLVERVEKASGERVIRVRDAARVRRVLTRYAPTADLIEKFRALWEDFYG